MKLPDSPWLGLKEALQWLTRQGASEEAVKERLQLAFRDGEITVYGRSHTYFPSQERTTIESRYFDNAQFFWDTSTISIEEKSPEIPYDKLLIGRPGSLTYRSKTHYIHDVEVRRDSLIAWLDSGDTKDQMQNLSRVDASVVSRQGRKAKYEWDEFYIEIAVKADLDALPESQAELEKYMADWCLENWGEQPAVSTIRSKISPIYRHPRKINNQ